MTLCDMCGKETDLVVAIIEGSEMNVCSQCARFGKIIRKIKPPEPIKKEIEKVGKEEPEKEIIENIVESYGKIIKEAREKLGLKQEDFAKKINEKASLIHKIESEHQKPSIDFAKKIEKFLKIKLIEEEKLEKIKLDKSDSESFTIGDIIKLK